MSKKEAHAEKTTKPSRRDFLQTGLLTAAGISALGAANSARAQSVGSEAFQETPAPGADTPTPSRLNVLILMVDEQRYPTVYESAALRQFRRQYLVSYDSEGNRDPEKEALYEKAGRLEDYGFSGWVGPEPHGRSPLNSASSAGGGKKGRDAAIAGQAVELLQQLEASGSFQPWLAVVSFVNPHDIALWGLASRLGERLGLYDFSVGAQVPAELFDPAMFLRTRGDDLDRKPGCQKSYRDAYRQFFQPAFETPDYFRFYYQAHQNVDAQLGRVHAALRESRFFDNTLVVFTSDHGDLLGAHNGLHQKWYQAYDEALRVPLVFSNPLLFSQPQSHALPTSHVDILPTLLGLAGINAEQTREHLAQTHSEARPLVGRNLAPLLLGLPGGGDGEAPVYFMTDDDPSRGPDQENIIGIPYDSVVQPNHIEAVVARVGDKLWKYARYFDNPQFWSNPGQPGRLGVKDVVVKPATLSPDTPGEQVVAYTKRVKVAPPPDEYEMYDLAEDPLELTNLAGDPAYAATEAALRVLLAQQCAQKRLTPSSASVPGQARCV